MDQETLYLCHILIICHCLKSCWQHSSCICESNFYHKVHVDFISVAVALVSRWLIIAVDNWDVVDTRSTLHNSSLLDLPRPLPILKSSKIQQAVVHQVNKWPYPINSTLNLNSMNCTNVEASQEHQELDTEHATDCTFTVAPSQTRTRSAMAAASQVKRE